MPELQEPPKKQTHKQVKNSFLPICIIILFFFIAIGSIWFLFLKNQNSTETTNHTPLHQQNDFSLKDHAPALPQNGSPIPATDHTNTFIDNSFSPSKNQDTEHIEIIADNTITAEKKNLPDCAELATELHIFFTQMDKKEYMQTFSLGETSQTYFLKLVNKLFDNPPVVVRESDDLFTILRNMAHFFRVIGRKNILLIKTILDREAEKIEDIARDLYFYTITENCDQGIFPLKAPVEKMYEYAGFFINTMGGRSYLFRRDSRSRLLINYYSILIINRANKNSMNQYGIAINQSIAQLINEIESTTQLIYRENYLDKLYELAERYPISPITEELQISNPK